VTGSNSCRLLRARSLSLLSLFLSLSPPPPGPCAGEGGAPWPGSGRRGPRGGAGAGSWATARERARGRRGGMGRLEARRLVLLAACLGLCGALRGTRPTPPFPVPVPCPAAGARAAPAWRGGREEGAEQGARSALRWPWEAPGRVVPSRSPLPLPGGAVGGGDRSACKTSSNCSPARPGPSAPGRPAAVSRVGACSELRGLPRGLGVLKAASWLYS
jgi:hypothetical protein